MSDEKYDTTEQREYAPPAPKMTAGRYIATRIPTLKPAHDKVANPIALLRLLNLQQWLFFLVAFRRTVSGALTGMFSIGLATACKWRCDRCR